MSNSNSSADATLVHTPLYGLHLDLGAEMVPFAGYAMPVQFPSGILKEHLHTRTGAGLFDVSQLGQMQVCGNDAARALESLMPMDICSLDLDRQRYALVTNEAGGIRDDLMITRTAEHFSLVVNASCKDQDFAYLCERVAAVGTGALPLRPRHRRYDHTDGSEFALGVIEITAQRVSGC